MANRKTFDSDSEGEEGLGLFTSLGKIAEEESDQEENNQDEDLLASSDSDAAPDDIAFTSSRQMALQNIKDTLSQIRTDQAKQKEKRKKKEELYKDQKEKRLKALANQRLPDDFLEHLSDEPEKKKQIKEAETSPDEHDEEDRLNDMHDLSDQDTAEDVMGADYIALERTGIEVLPMKNIQKQAQSSSDRAKDFRQEMLYGSRVKRVSTEDFLCEKKKKKVGAKR